MKLKNICQVRIDPTRKKTRTRAAQVRRQNLSTFVRNRTDAGAASRLHQVDLLRQFRILRRTLNAAAAASQVRDSEISLEKIEEALAQLRKLER
jgi:hypothetical protein